MKIARLEIKGVRIFTFLYDNRRTETASQSNI